MKSVRVINQTHPGGEPILAKYCQSFACQLRGLMFTKSLPEHNGLLLVQGSDSRVNAAIHMMFMSIDLAVFWFDKDYILVDKVLARRWKLAYIPKKAARYVLEANIARLDDYDIGDITHFEDIVE